MFRRVALPQHHVLTSLDLEHLAGLVHPARDPDARVTLGPVDPGRVAVQRVPEQRVRLNVLVGLRVVHRVPVLIGDAVLVMLSRFVPRLAFDPPSKFRKNVLRFGVGLAPRRPAIR